MVTCSRNRPVASTAASLEPVRRPGIDAQHPLAPGRRGQQQVAQVLGKDRDGRLIGPLLRLQPQFHLDGRGDQPLVGILDHPFQERPEDALPR